MGIWVSAPLPRTRNVAPAGEAFRPVAMESMVAMALPRARICLEVLRLGWGEAEVVAAGPTTGLSRRDHDVGGRLDVLELPAAVVPKDQSCTARRHGESLPQK